MDVLPEDRPRLVQGQYVAAVGNYSLYYNPMGYGGVTLVGPVSRTLLSLCDGARTVAEILAQNVGPPSDVLSGIRALANSEVVSLSERFTRALHDGVQRTTGISCWLHLTNRCNLACTYCYIHKSSGGMSIETGRLAIDRVIQTCRAHSIPSVNIKFAGGEPLLRYGLVRKLVDHARRNCGDVKVTFSLLTNGTLITQEVADYLKTHDISVGLSLDGVGSANDQCRHAADGQGSFQRIVEGLSMLARSGIRPSISTTVSQSNHKHLRDLTEFLVGGEYRFRFSLERDCASGWPGLVGHSEALIQSLHGCYDYVEANLPKRDFTRVHTLGDVNFKRPARIACGAGSSYFAIGHDRKIGACQMGLSEPFSTLDPHVDLLTEVRTANPELCGSQASDYPHCQDCTWRKSCAGGCPLQTRAAFGRLDRPSPYCRVYKEILPRILRIRAAQMVRDSEGTSLSDCHPATAQGGV